MMTDNGGTGGTSVEVYTNESGDFAVVETTTASDDETLASEIVADNTAPDPAPASNDNAK